MAGGGSDSEDWDDARAWLAEPAGDSEDDDEEDEQDDDWVFPEREPVAEDAVSKEVVVGGIVIGDSESGPVMTWNPPDLPATRGGEPAMANGGGGPEAVYALLRCESVVVVGEAFPLDVGLSAEPVPDVFGEPMFPPARYRLTIDVVIDGFSLAPGETDVLTFDVTPEAPYPTTTMHLMPLPGLAGRTADIRAIFAADGQPMGVAFRPVSVVTEAEQAAEGPEPPPPPGISVSQQQADRTVDLTMMVFSANAGTAGDVLIRFGSHHAGVELPRLVVHLGEDVEAFARTVVGKMGLAETSRAAIQKARGLGRFIAKTLPPAFTTVLKAVAARVAPAPVRILLLTTEPYVPWELAVVDRLDGGRGQGFLGAQAVVGRWVLPNDLPEPGDLPITDVLVVNGHYQDGTLAAAEEEARELGQVYGAVAVNATIDDVLACLEGEPPGEVIHFAVHGRNDPGGALNGLKLVDDQYVDPETVEGSDLGGQPFVFLNACQVGTGQAQLGVYGGMAAAFLSRGATAVVAPLWSVKDTVAKDIALGFYAQAFDDVPVGEVIRRERARFGEPGVSPTVLAYQYFGHPALTLRRAPRDGGH